MATLWQRVFRAQGPTSAGKTHEPIAPSYFVYLTELHLLFGRITAYSRKPKQEETVLLGNELFSVLY